MGLPKQAASWKIECDFLPQYTSNKYMYCASYRFLLHCGKAIRLGLILPPKISVIPSWSYTICFPNIFFLGLQFNIFSVYVCSLKIYVISKFPTKVSPKTFKIVPKFVHEIVFEIILTYFFVYFSSLKISVISSKWPDSRSVKRTRSHTKSTSISRILTKRYVLYDLISTI